MTGAWMMMVLMEIDAMDSLSQVSFSYPFNGVVVVLKIYGGGRAPPCGDVMNG